MQLIQEDLFSGTSPASPSGKTCPASSVTEKTPSVAFWERLPVKMGQSSRQGKNGRTLVVCLDPKGQSLGGSSMPNISEWPNDAAVCSLSQVLVKGSIPQKYFLSQKACAGILRRAEMRGKKLPILLHQTLSAVAEGSNGAEKPEGTLRTSTGGGNKPHVLTVHGTQDPCVQSELAHTLGLNNGGENVLFQNLTVRRLMPVECERLQGMPDGHTDAPYRNKQAADGPRYKAIGNSKAVPCIKFIGQRIEKAVAA